MAASRKAAVVVDPGGGWYSFQKAEASAMAAGTPAA